MGSMTTMRLFQDPHFQAQGYEAQTIPYYNALVSMSFAIIPISPYTTPIENGGSWLKEMTKLVVPIGVILGLHWGYNRIMENKNENYYLRF